ncbi:MAG: hypothetical protein H6834_06370 [Planctomycetes bacterium]|nr:hypothetical protein [Planctomycetota bacterium]
MKITNLVTPVALVLAFGALASSNPIVTDPDSGPELKGAMRQINQAVKALAEVVDDPSKAEEALGHVHSLQAALMIAKTQVPDTAEELEGKAKDKFVAGFKKEIIAMFQESLALETALIDGNGKAAKKSLQKIGGMKNAGHKNYKG